MILRIVRMRFKEEEIDRFLELFREVKGKIRASEGCLHLELMRDHHQRNILVTYSRWESQEHLDRYRSSVLFAETWKKTKVLFSGKPEAYSLSALPD